MSRYIDADKFKKELEQSCVYKAIVLNILDRQPTADVAMDKQIETIFREILIAIETGTTEATNIVVNSTTVLDFRKILIHTGEMYAGCIGKAICEVFKKYTEEVK